MTRIDMYRLVARTLAAPPEALKDLSAAWERAKDDWPQLLQLATQHRVAPVLYTAMSARGLLDVLPGDFRAVLSALRLFNRDRNERIVVQAREITATLNAAGITPLYLKGAAHVLTGLYDDLGDRMMGDMDVFVGDEDLARAVTALQAIGYANENSKHYYDTGQPRTHHHYPPLSREDLPAAIEVHRALLLSPFDHMFRSARAHEQLWQDGDARYATLSSAHAFAQSVLHAEVQHYHTRLGVTHLGMLLDSLRLARQASESELEEAMTQFKNAKFQHFVLRHAGLMTELFGADAVPAPLRLPCPRGARNRFHRQLGKRALARLERIVCTFLLIVNDDWQAGKKQWGDAPLQNALVKRLFRPGLYRNRLQKFARYYSAKV